MKDRMDYYSFISASIRNKPGRNLATVFCFAFIAASIFSGQYLIAGARGGLDQGVTRMGADIMVVPSTYTALRMDLGGGRENSVAIVRIDPVGLRFSASAAAHIRNISGVASTSPQLFVTTLDVPELSSNPVDIYGFDPATDFTIQPWLRHPLDHLPGAGDVIAGSEISGDISSKITIKGQPYRIAGKLDPTRSPIDRTIFMSMEDAYLLAGSGDVVTLGSNKISPGDVSAIMVRVSPGADPDRVGALIRQPSPYIDVVGRHFTLDPVSQDISGLPNLLNMIAMVAIVTAFPLIALIAAMVAHERQREIGLLKSLGAKRRLIFSLVFAESLVLAAVGGIAGVGVTLVTFFLLNTAGVLNNTLQVSFRMPTLWETGLMIGIALCIVIAIGSIASLWPAYRSSRMNPYDAIRFEGQ